MFPATRSRAGRRLVMPTLHLPALMAVLLLGCATPDRYLPGPDGSSSNTTVPDADSPSPPAPKDGATPAIDAPASPAPDAALPGDGPCGAPDDPRNCGTCGHDCT